MPQMLYKIITITNAKNSIVIDIIKKRLHASACNLKKNNCEKKAIKNLSPPTSEDERKKIFDI